MAKVHINGEVFEFDTSRKPMTEMLALEAALKTTYGQWEQDFTSGSASALAGYVWLVWRRNGRDVKYEDILSGEVEFNYADFQVESDDPPDPTTAAASREASTLSGEGISGRSRRSSTSAPGR